MQFLPAIFPLFLSISISLSGKTIRTNLFVLLLVFAVLTFTFYHGARDYQSGTDSIHYATYFENPETIPSHWEIGYTFWLWFLRLFSSDYRFYFLVETLVKLSLLAVAAASISKKYGKNVALLIYITMVYSFPIHDLFTNGLRQGFAASMTVFAISQVLLKRNPVAFVLLLIGSSLHYSNLVLVLSFGLMAITTVRPLTGRMFIFALTVVTTLAFLATFLGLDLGQFFFKIVRDLLAVFGFDQKLLRLSPRTFGSMHVFTLGALFRYAMVIVFVLITGLLVVKRKRETEEVFLVGVALLLVFVFLVQAYQGYSYRFMYLVNIVAPFLLVFWLGTNSSRLVRFPTNSSLFRHGYLFLVLAYYVRWAVLLGGFADFKYF